MIHRLLALLAIAAPLLPSAQMEMSSRTLDGFALIGIDGTGESGTPESEEVLGHLVEQHTDVQRPTRPNGDAEG